MGQSNGKGHRGRTPILGAAILRALLGPDGESGGAAQAALYRGVLRDLGLSDETVVAYLKDHRDEVAAAMRAHAEPEI